jgi:hypothetical protein
MAMTNMSWLSFMPSADQTLFQDMVAFYNFDGNTVDTSGQGNDANTSGTFTTTTDHHGTTNGAYTFNGTNNYMTTTNSLDSPQDYSTNVWFKSSSNGGVLIAFTNAQTGTSETNYDRIMWLDTTGHLNFGVWINADHYITSTGTYFDGNWHMATATMSSTTGMGLYVDGVSVASDTNTTSQVYTGWWRIGQSATNSWPATMRSFFSGSIDEVRIYSAALNATQVAELYTL